MLQMKAPSLLLRERCKAAPANGGIPVPKEAQEAQDRTAQEAQDGTNELQGWIASMEAMKQPDTDKAIATFKQEIAKLKPKLPKIHQRLEDQAHVLEVVRELRGKKPREKRC